MLKERKLKKKLNGFLQLLKNKVNADIQQIHIDDISVEIRKKNIKIKNQVRMTGSGQDNYLKFIVK